MTTSRPDRPERGGVHSLRDILDASGLGSRGRAERVFRAWRGAVDGAVAKHTRPVRFARGELVVEVDSSVVLHELRGFTGDECRRRANAALQRDAIDKLVLKLKHRT